MTLEGHAAPHGGNDPATASPRWLLFLLLALVAASPAFADGGVTFTDIAEDGGAGIDFARQPNPDRQATMEAIEARGTIPADEWRDVRALETPMKLWGSPGVAIFDYDRDGDVDVFVTNGPGAANSLYSNQLVEAGTLTFVDEAAAAGIDATDQESAGVCYGDIDNDGDDDVYVLGTGEPNRLFANQLSETGQATFVNITATAGVGGGDRHPSGCSMADFNGDGLLDIVVGNTYESWAEHRRPTFIPEICPCLEHNQLFINQGGNVFSDESAAAGIETIVGMPDASYTWAIASVDYDLDGDVDILFADTQGPSPMGPGEDRGYNRIFENDGTGQFTDVTLALGLDKHGSWMGYSFGDFNCDGYMDFFNTNLGDYVPATLGLTTSRWFLGGPDGFTDPGVGDLVSTAFGWGTVTPDYDNDGDTDIIYHGGMDVMTVIFGDNPGLVLQNQGCSANFEYDFDAVTREHRNRSVQGVAMGDLNEDGFMDVVSVADSVVVPSDFWLPWSGILAPPFDSPLDPLTRFEGVWIGGDGVITFLEPTVIPGNLSVEINSGDNGNGWVGFDPLGGVGLVPGASVNRSGIGAVFQFTPTGGPTSMHPVAGGASYASQDQLTQFFGLGAATSGDLEVLWPGGVRNRVYDVSSEERLVVPEIPCSYDGDWANRGEYTSCVNQALNGYVQAGAISPADRERLRSSAERAFDEGDCPVGTFGSSEYPDFCFGVRIGESGASIPGTHMESCVDDTVCVSGALPGRAELFLRILGPRPNGFLWPTITRFTPSRVEVDFHQKSTGQTQRYVLPAVPPGTDDLPGLQDRTGFQP